MLKIFSKKIIPIFHQVLFCILLISMSMGCLETPVAEPALIDEVALQAYGWSQTGDIEYNTYSQDISNSTALTFNSTLVRYQNDRLASDIETQGNEFKEEYRLPAGMEIPTLTAHITTNRITLPGKASIPSELIAKIIENSVEDMKEQSNMDAFNESRKMQLVADNGADIYLTTFTGTMPIENSSLKMLGFVAVIGTRDSSTIVYGTVPNGTLPVNIGPLEANLFSIDGEEELAEMIEIVKTIE